MKKYKNIVLLLLTAFILILASCADNSVPDEQEQLSLNDHSDMNTEDVEAQPRVPDDGQNNNINNIWNDFDFLIMTDYPNRYDGAPIACPPYWRDKTGEMSVSDMLASIDDTAFVFNLLSTEGLYLKFSYNSDIIPAEIKGAYYINGNNETERHYLNNLIKVPEEIGVYNFFVDLEWDDGTEEVVFFRVQIKDYEIHEN